MIKTKSNEIRKHELRAENEHLRNQIELAKQQLINLETRNGKKQIHVPGVKQSATSTTATATSTATTANANNVKTSPKPAADSQKTASAKPPKEKKPKTEKPAAEKATAAASNSEEPVDIGRIDLRIGKIVEIQKHPDADSLYVEKIDVGEEKPRTVVSGLVKWVPIEEMQNRLVVVMCNLKPAKMRGILSEGMLMCASTPDKVECIIPPATSVPGDLVHCDGFNRNPDAQLNPKKKVWESVAPDLKTNNELTACYKGAALQVPGKGTLKAATLKDANVK